MTNHKNLPKSLILAIGLFSLGLYSCADEKTSLHNPNYEAPQADPVITAIEPASGYLAGIDKITITGANFVADTATTRVYFNGLPGVTLSATSTQLEVRPSAQATGNPLIVKAVVLGAENFSNEFNYRIDPPLISLAGVRDSDKPWAVTLDKDGNIYTHIVRDGTDFGIQKVDVVTGDVSSFQSPPNAGSNVFRWNSLKFGPDGFLYGVRGNRAIFRNQGGSVAFSVAKTISGGAAVDLDFDANGDLWIAASSGVFRLDMENTSVNNTFTLNSTAFESVRSIRVIQNDVFILGIVEDLSGENSVQVWKYSIDVNRNLTSGLLISNLSEKLNNPRLDAYSMVVSTDNSLYVGVNSTNGILKVTFSGDVSVLYPGIIQTRIVNMAWDSSRILYLVAEETKDVEGNILTNQRVYGLNMLEQRSAIYHGIQ